jgi:hypothetical protein
MCLLCLCRATFLFQLPTAFTIGLSLFTETLQRPIDSRPKYSIVQGLGDGVDDRLL